MKIKNLTMTGALLVAFVALASEQSHAGIMFQFTESGGNVLMTTSGTLETANLVSANYSGWGGTGIETNNSPESDIMGDTATKGQGDVAFGFHAGTDLSPWVGDMFTSSNFGWSTTGTTQFALYILDPIRTPGIGISTFDMVGSLWTPDISWSKAGTFASLGLTQGTYTVVDGTTGESIAVQIGSLQSVPEPASLAIFGTICLVACGRRRRKS